MIGTFIYFSVPSGFPQSLSGSETDVSTSNENLSREERYVVRHTARVEPQGQENQSQSNNNNNRNSLKVNVVTLNTLHTLSIDFSFYS